MEIHENIEEVSYIFTMRSSYLFSSACEECIIYNIKENSYDIIQKLGGLEGDTSKSIELENGDIITLSIGFYIFKLDPALNTYSLFKTVNEGKFLNDVIQISNDKIITSTNEDSQLKIWDIKEWSCITNINNIQLAPYNNCLYKLDSNNLIIGGNDSIYLMDLNTYEIKKKIKSIWKYMKILKK